MKSLKRTLSLVLVLVMVLGLFGVASAAFTDDAKIQYKEAVEVMTGIGAINGYTDGSFNPTGTITRAEAAKLVAYTILGADIAAGLGGVSSRFTDVGADYAWAIPSIEYLASKGIINGLGDGTFNPEGNVTGYELGKMLLCAIGYGAKGEYVGDSWSLNVAIDGGKKGIYDNRVTGAGLLSAAATREEAALYCFNAITNKNAGMVEYSNLLGSYMPVVIGSVTTIADAVYPTLEEKTVAGGIDIFGRPAARTWEYKSKTISTVFTQSPVAVYTTPVTYSAIYNAFGLKAEESVNTYTNGKSTTGSIDVTKSDVTSTIGGYGQRTELYKDPSTGALSAVVISNFLAKVTNVVAHKAPTATTAEVDASITATIYSATGATAGKTFATEGFAKDDYIIVTVADNEIQSAVKANSMDGVMTAYSTGSITLGTTTLPIMMLSRNITAGNALVSNQASIGFTDTYTYFLDSNNAVVGAIQKTANIPTDYAYVKTVQYHNSTGSLLEGAAQAAKAQVIFPDGTSAVVDMKITNAGTAADPEYKVDMPQADGTVKATQKLETSAATDIGNWFAYAKDADGKYTFVAVNAAYAAVVDGVTLNANATTSISSKYTTSGTKVTRVDANGVATSFTGFPATQTALTGKVLYTYALNSNVISGIYAVAQAPVVASVTYAYAVKGGNTTQYGTQWTFAVNGEQVTYVISGAQPTKDKVYTLTTASNGTYTATEVTNEDTTVIATGETVTVADATFFVTGNGTYTYATTYGVFNVDPDAATIGMTDTVGVGDTVTVITVGGKVTAVYITAEYEG